MDDIRFGQDILEPLDVPDTFATRLSAMKILGPAKVFLQREVIVRHAIKEQRPVAMRIGADQRVTAVILADTDDLETRLG